MNNDMDNDITNNMDNNLIFYSLTPFDPSGHKLKVQLTIKSPDPKGQLLFMPTWIPGSYLIRDFGRQVETIKAYTRDGSINIKKTNNYSWLCDPCNSPLTIEYTVYAWDLSVRSAHFDESHAFFNGTSVFLGVDGQLDTPCQLTLLPPSHTNKWHVYTSFKRNFNNEHKPNTPKNISSESINQGFGNYYANDYDELIDHPVEMGTPQVISFDAYGVKHEMVFTGIIPNLDLERIAADTKKICEAQISLFEPEKKIVPTLDSSNKYVFMTMVTGIDYGGLEHRSSTALMISRKDLPSIGCDQAPSGYMDFLGLVSHEYFHSWNVKRIKPQVFAPYNTTEENYTDLLWVFEGFTSYYDDLMLYRVGVTTQQTYFERLGKVLGLVHQLPGRFKQSVAQSSFDTWTRFYKQDENSPNALVSYYSKGSLVALGLDLLIRQESNNTKSLDDVMRYMWQEYGKDFYTSDKNGVGKGIAEDQMPAIVKAATGIDTTDYINKYAYGCEDIPLAELLEQHKVTLNRKPNNKLPSLDARPIQSGQMVALANVYDGGSAHTGGLSANDKIIAIDGLHPSSIEELNSLLAQYQAGNNVQIHVLRRDELRSFNVTLNQAPLNKFELKAQEGNTWPNTISI